MKNKTTAGIFGLLLGGIGIHKFYLGKTGIGIVYLLLFWTFIPAIVGFIEGIMYLTMSDADFDVKFNGKNVGQAESLNSSINESNKYAKNNDRIRELYQKMELEIKTEKEMLNADYTAGKINREELQDKLKYWNNEELKIKNEKKDIGM